MGPHVEPPLGRRFGRPDIERCDLFVDAGAFDWGKYPEKPVILNEACKKGAQMHSSIPSGGHKKCGIEAQSGYFETTFKTIAVNEPYLEKWRITGRPPPHPLKGPWIPARPAPKHSTPGDNHGTFTKNSDYKAFSPITKPARKEKELINFLTNPSKKGHNGYLDIGINKYPPHTVNGRIDSYLASEMQQSINWKRHKYRIRNGPFNAGFYPRYFDGNPYKDSVIGPTYVERKEKVYGESRGLFHPPGAPKKPGNNHDGCFEKFPAWTPEPYMTASDAMKRLGRPKNPELVFRPEPSIKSYYTVSVVNNKVGIACNERTWRTMKPITYPQFNL